MKNNNISKICNITCIILLLVFIIKSLIDYINYNPINTSAPYYVFLIINAFYFLLPLIIVFIIGIVVKNLILKRKNHD